MKMIQPLYIAEFQICVRMRTRAKSSAYDSKNTKNQRRYAVVLKRERSTVVVLVGINNLVVNQSVVPLEAEAWTHRYFAVSAAPGRLLAPAFGPVAADYAVGFASVRILLREVVFVQADVQMNSCCLCCCSHGSWSAERPLGSLEKAL